jgi:arginyl-tRNA synthetase
MAAIFGAVSESDAGRRLGEQLLAVASERWDTDVSDALVHQSPPGHDGDYQSTLALRLSKTAGVSSMEVAARLAEGMASSDLCEPATVSGKGFVNFRLRREFIETAAGRIAADPRLGVAYPDRRLRVVLDYSAPNVAKEMHVGHLRSTIIGDAIRRLLEHLGHDVVPQNHLGDWGTPFGMLVEHMLDVGADSPGQEVEDLTKFYQAARAKFDCDPAFAERARDRVVLLQQGDEASLAVWQQLRDVSETYFDRIYQMLGVGLRREHSVGESFFNPMLADVVSELQSLGLVTESDGALCIFLPGYVSRDGDPMPIIVQKRDGGFNYDTTDLAAIRYRLRELHADAILYVVGAPQALHFKMLFDAVAAAKWAHDDVELRHIAFGSVLGEDGKMLKTRAGHTVKLIDLLEEAISRADDLLQERAIGSEDRESVARAVGIGAVKYADLASDRMRDYTFEFDRMLSFEGNTAAYLQYAYARACSLLRKQGLQPSGPGDGSPVRIAHPEERALALQLMRFGTQVSVAAELMQPHKLCSYLHELASCFSRFYEACPVAGTEAEVREPRLTLTAATARTLSTGLGLLGIETPAQL